MLSNIQSIDIHLYTSDRNIYWFDSVWEYTCIPTFLEDSTMYLYVPQGPIGAIYAAWHQGIRCLHERNTNEVQTHLSVCTTRVPPYFRFRNVNNIHVPWLECTDDVSHFLRSLYMHQIKHTTYHCIHVQFFPQLLCSPETSSGVFAEMQHGLSRMLLHAVRNISVTTYNVHVILIVTALCSIPIVMQAVATWTCI